MIKVVITEDIRNKVLTYAKKHFPTGTDEHYGRGFDGSDRRDITGTFGEVIVVHYLHRDVDGHLAKRPLDRGDGGIDIYIDNQSYDIKTKARNVRLVDESFDASVAVDQHNKSPADGYIFCNVFADYSEGQIMGWMMRGEYASKAKYWNKGDFDGPFEFPTDAYNLAYGKLRPFDFTPDPGNPVVEVTTKPEPRHICADEATGNYCAHIFCQWSEKLWQAEIPVPEPCPRWHKHR